MSILSSLFRSRDKPQNRVGSAFSFLFGGTTSGIARAIVKALEDEARKQGGWTIHLGADDERGSGEHPLQMLICMMIY